MLKFVKRINYLLHLKYRTDALLYNKIIIENIIFNDKTHLVSIFKDYLIEFEEYDFLKRYYTEEESKKKMKKILTYYQKYNWLFPNYSVFPEADLIYKNINLKQNIIDNLERNEKNKKYQNGEKKTDADADIKKNLNSKESTDNLVFNSVVYDSIFKETENCLSVFSFDKESTYNEDKDDEGINKLIKSFNTIDYNINNTTNNNNKIEITQKNNNKNENIILRRSLNQVKSKNNEFNKDNEDFNNINNIILKKNDNNNNNKIYKRKKTPNNMINSKFKNFSSSHTVYLRNKLLYDKEELSNYDTINHNTYNTYNSNNESINISLNKTKNGIYKKIKLNFIEPSIKDKGTSSSFIGLPREKPIINKSLAINNPNKTSILFNNENIKVDSTNSTVINKINDIPIKINILVEESHLPRIKVNTKKIEKRNKNTFINNKLILDSNKYSAFHHHKPKTNSCLDIKKLYHKLDKNNKFDNNSTNENLKDSINELNCNTYNCNNSNILKETKINLIKNKIKNTQSFNYVINNYNSKLISYNTSIQLNNNNINIFNTNNNNNANSLTKNKNNRYRNDRNEQFNKSNSLWVNTSVNKNNNVKDNISLSRSNNIRRNTQFNDSNNLRETTPFNRCNIIFENTPFIKNKNTSDIHTTPYERKIIVSENGRNKNNFLNKTTYFTCYNNNRRKRIISNDIFRTMDKSCINNNSNNELSISDRYSIPLNNRLNSKLLSKLNIKPKNDILFQKYRTISTKKDKRSNIDKEMNKSEIDKKPLFTNNIQFNNDKNSSFVFRKSEKLKNVNHLENIYTKNTKPETIKLIKKKNNQTNCDNNNNSNIMNKNFVRKVKKRNNNNKKFENLNIKNIEKRILKILNESNEEINLIKQRFFRKAENKYNLNHSKIKNDINLKGNFLTYQKNK